MRTCGKTFHVRDVITQCGAQLPGSDWIHQCPECAACDRVEAAIQTGNRQPVMTDARAVYHAKQFNGVPEADPNERAVDEILARLESYYRGDEQLARGAKHLSVNTDDLRTLADYIKFMRGQLRAANQRRG